MIEMKTSAIILISFIKKMLFENAAILLLHFISVTVNKQKQDDFLISLILYKQRLL